MLSLALARHALSAHFCLAICNIGRGRKPQNQFSIRLLAPWKVIHFTSHKRCASFARKLSLQEICQSFWRRTRLCLGNESQAYNKGTKKEAAFTCNDDCWSKPMYCELQLARSRPAIALSFCRSVCCATTNHSRNLGRFGTRQKLWAMSRNAP